MLEKTVLKQEYLLNGKSTRDLSKQFNVCQRTIMNWLENYNIKKDTNQWVKERHSKIKHTLFKKGHDVPDEWRKISSRVHKGNARHNIPHSEETKELISNKLKGRFCGELNPNWKGGISSERTQFRGSVEYKKWRIDVFKRDNYICQRCGNAKEYLHAHHIKLFKEEMDNYDVSNGLTVCYKCHEEIHGFKLGKGSKYYDKN